jgi:hypothetical protein
MGGVTVTGKAGLTNDKFATVVIRLVGGPADGLVFVVPQRNLPKLVGIPSLGDGRKLAPHGIMIRAADATTSPRNWKR